MNKGLEALEIIRDAEVEIGNEHNTATKLFDISNDYDECFEIIEKSLKALEIIKNKFYFEWLFVSNGVEQFNEAQDNEENKLTKEEYDLLKEVLL